jgi:hypothetical protein
MKLLAFRPLCPEPVPPNGVLISEWTVGKRTVRVVQDVHAATGSTGMLRTEWDPDRPRRLSKREWREYRAGRDAHWQQVANILGRPVALAEL